MLAAQQDGQFLGLIFYDIDDGDAIDSHLRKCGVVIEFVVREESRGRGIGKALLQAVENFFEEQGATHARLHCSSSNPLAHRFYEREGYTPRQQLFCKELLPVAAP